MNSKTRFTYLYKDIDCWNEHFQLTLIESNATKEKKLGYYRKERGIIKENFETAGRGDQTELCELWNCGITKFFLTIFSCFLKHWINFFEIKNDKGRKNLAGTRRKFNKCYHEAFFAEEIWKIEKPNKMLEMLRDKRLLCDVREHRLTQQWMIIPHFVCS